MRPHDHLIAAQRADGSWDMTPVLARVLGIDLDVLEARMPDPATDPRLWATMLALSWLHLRAGQHQDEWQLLAAKAEAWLKWQGAAEVIVPTREAAEEVVRTS